MELGMQNSNGKELVVELKSFEYNEDG